METATEKFFVLKNRDGKYIELDHGSGGYPSAVDTFAQAKIWNNREAVLVYAKMFPELQIYELSICLEPHL